MDTSPKALTQRLATVAAAKAEILAGVKRLKAITQLCAGARERKDYSDTASLAKRATREAKTLTGLLSELGQEFEAIARDFPAGLTT